MPGTNSSAGRWLSWIEDELVPGTKSSIALVSKLEVLSHLTATHDEVVHGALKVLER